MSVLPSLPQPLWLPLPWDVVRILLRFLISKRYSCPSSLSMTSSLPAALSTNLPVQISDSRRSRATSTGVDNCPNMRTHLFEVQEQVLLCCRLLCQEDRRFHIIGQLVSCALLMSLFKVFPCLKSVRAGLRA